MTTPYVLHYAPDNASLIVRLALEERGLPYRTMLVDRANGGLQTAGYRALNPAGRIPVIETPEGPIFETAAILLWLADRHGGLAPGPTDPGRAELLSWLFFLSNTLHAALVRQFYVQRYGPPETHGALLRTGAGHVSQALDLLHGAYGDAGPWMRGDRPGLCNLYLGPLLRWCVLFPRGETAWFDIARWPRLARMARALEARPSALAAQQAEGLGPTPFSAPVHADPPEGSAT